MAIRITGVRISGVLTVLANKISCHEPFYRPDVSSRFEDKERKFCYTRKRRPSSTIFVAPSTVRRKGRETETVGFHRMSDGSERWTLASPQLRFHGKLLHTASTDVSTSAQKFISNSWSVNSTYILMRHQRYMKILFHCTAGSTSDFCLLPASLELLPIWKHNFHPN